LLQLVDVTVAQVLRVSNQLLAVKASHHTMLERLFVAQKLREDCAQLQVVLAQVTQFK